MNRLTITDLKEIINGHRSYSYSEQDIGNAVKSFNFLESTPRAFFMPFSILFEFFI